MRKLALLVNKFPQIGHKHYENDNEPLDWRSQSCHLDGIIVFVLSL